jgi:hypothetical protein
VLKFVQWVSFVDFDSFLRGRQGGDSEDTIMDGGTNRAAGDGKNTRRVRRPGRSVALSIIIDGGRRQQRRKLSASDCWSLISSAFVLCSSSIEILFSSLRSRKMHADHELIFETEPT